MSKHETIVSASTLGEHLDDPRWRIVDCRFSLLAPEQGSIDYASGHIPGAVYAHLDHDLAAPIGAQTGRHPLPDSDDFIARLRYWGINNESQVVVYDDASGGLAARLWWMLRWHGHHAVAVLDGGYAGWLESGRPISDEILRHVPGDFSGRPDPELTLSTDELVDRLAGDSGFLLVDARDAARFRGDVEPIDAVGGHVPGAVNLPFVDSLDGDQHWRSNDELKTLWSNVGALRAGTEWAVMCGSGVTACHLALSAELAALPAPRLYVGSWSEWIRDPDRPVAVGPAADESPRRGGCGAADSG